MSDVRTEIPIPLKRKILVEAGHRCAIPTCRVMEVIIHHIIPWENCKEHNYENLIALCPNCHTKVHQGKIDRKSLRMYKHNLKFLYDRFSIFEMDVLFELYNPSKYFPLALPNCFLLLIKRIIDEGYVHPIRTEIDIFKPLDMTPLILTLTDKGKDFISKISKEDIGY